MSILPCILTSRTIARLMLLLRTSLKTGWMAEWIERSPRSREVVGSSPGHAKPKALKLVLIVSSLDA